MEWVYRKTENGGLSIPLPLEAVLQDPSGFKTKHQLWWVCPALVSVCIRRDRTWHLQIYRVTCYPAVCHDSDQCDCSHRKTERPQRLWVCDVKCGQGVPGLALTTEQGSVFVQGSYITCKYIVCSRASLSHRRAVNVGRTCGKANSIELFFGFWWG